jgi:hypothetical protein
MPFRPGREYNYSAVEIIVNGELPDLEAEFVGGRAGKSASFCSIIVEVVNYLPYLSYLGS